MDPRSGVKDYVRLPVFHLNVIPTEVEGSFLQTGKYVGEGKAKKEAPRCRLSEGACVHMAAVQ